MQMLTATQRRYLRALRALTKIIDTTLTTGERRKAVTECRITFRKIPVASDTAPDPEDTSYEEWGDWNARRAIDSLACLVYGNYLDEEIIDFTKDEQDIFGDRQC